MKDKNIEHLCKFCGCKFETGPLLGNHVRSCKNHPNREKRKDKLILFNNKYWNEENRKKHSDLMKDIVKNHPESYSINNVSGRIG